MKMIYLDYNATSPIQSEVREAIAPFLKERFGNASSIHQAGRLGRFAVESVRERLLAALGDPKGGVVFTSGGTEADNLALQGAMGALPAKRNHLIISAIEHSAVLHTAQALEKEGIRVSVAGVDRQGLVDLEALKGALTPETGLISVMHANNEVGTIQRIQEIGQMARQRGILFHTDAVQSFGKVPFNVQEVGADLVSLSAHKLGGLKGTGALYLRQGVPLKPLLHGGPHEGELRAGTENVVGIVGMGAALETTLREAGDGTLDRIRGLRNRLEQGLKKMVADIEVNGHPMERLPGTLNVSFLGCEGESLLMALDMAGICVSTGSACSSGSTQASHVLVAMGLPEERIKGSIRFSLGWGTTEEEIEESLRIIPPVVERVRKSRVIASGAKQSR